MHSTIPVAKEGRGEDGTPDAGPAAGRASDADAHLSAFSTDGWSKAVPNIEEEPHRAESGVRAFGQEIESRPGTVYHMGAMGQMQTVLTQPAQATRIAELPVLRIQPLELCLKTAGVA